METHILETHGWKSFHLKNFDHLYDCFVWVFSTHFLKSIMNQFMLSTCADRGMRRLFHIDNIFVGWEKVEHQ